VIRVLTRLNYSLIVIKAVNRNWLHSGECKFSKPSPIHVLPLRTASFCFLRSWVHLKLSRI